jgi:hypothetical protein
VSKRNFIIVVIVIVTLSSSLLLGGMSEERTLLFRTPNNNRVYVLNPWTLQKELLYECAENSWLHDLKVSPSGKYIGIIKTERGVTPPGSHELSVLPRNSLVIIDTAGNEIARLDEDVRKFSWSPDGEKIAYIAGTYYEGDVGFIPSHVGIFDVGAGTSEVIMRGRDLGREIRWARHDGNIYMICPGYVCRYDVRRGTFEEMPPWHSLDLSPDGRYYIWPFELGNDSLRLFRTRDNTEMTDQIRARFGDELRDISMEWVFDRGHMAHVVKYEYEFANERARRLGRAERVVVAYNVIYDVEADRIIKEVKHPVSRWTAGPGRLVLEKEGRFEVWTYENTVKK